jgi:cyanophycinase-like exopeptidase
MAGGKKGTLTIIGGAEAKIGNKAILEEVARFIGSGKLVITAVASEEQRQPSEEYDRIFRGLGIRHIHNLVIQTRAEGQEDGKLKILDEEEGRAMSIYDMKLRVMSQGDSFGLTDRRPKMRSKPLAKENQQKDGPGHESKPKKANAKGGGDENR